MNMQTVFASHTSMPMISAPMPTIQSTASGLQFPKFDLSRLLGTVFKPTFGRKICILIDLPDLAETKDYAFLKNPERPIQQRAHEHFYLALKNGVAEELALKGGEMYAYTQTTGSNLDLPDLCVDMSGKELSLEKDIYPNYDIILCISTFSATAPLTAFAKQYGFRGATLHGVNDVILNSGLAVDYEVVSVDAEKLRLAITRADAVEIDFTVANGPDMTVRLELSQQEAQKSHGLCQGDTPDIANLPAGEVYFVPTGAEGTFPLKYEDGTLGKLTVTGGRIIKAELIEGNQATIDAHNAKLADDPMTGVLGELGFGTRCCRSQVQTFRMKRCSAPAISPPVATTTSAATSRPRSSSVIKTPRTTTSFSHRTRRRISTSSRPACSATARSPCSTSTSSRRNTCWMHWRLNRPCA